MPTTHHFNVAEEDIGGAFVAPVRSLDRRVRIKRAILEELERQQDGSAYPYFQGDMESDRLLIDGALSFEQMLDAIENSIPDRPLRTET